MQLIWASSSRSTMLKIATMLLSCFQKYEFLPYRCITNYDSFRLKFFWKLIYKINYANSPYSCTFLYLSKKRDICLGKCLSLHINFCEFNSDTYLCIISFITLNRYLLFYAASRVNFFFRINEYTPCMHFKNIWKVYFYIRWCFVFTKNIIIYTYL